jgi:hypothetical protein
MARRLRAVASSGFLGQDELRALDAIFLAATRAVEELRQKHPVGRHLQRPKLPSALTEGLAAAIAPCVFGATAVARRPRSGRSDLVVTDGTGVERLMAVKGTGSARWISLTQTDMEASCLLWLDYTERIATESSSAGLWVFDGPMTRWASPGRATLRQAIERYGRAPLFILVDIPSLTAIPAPSAPPKAQVSVGAARLSV